MKRVTSKPKQANQKPFDPCKHNKLTNWIACYTGNEYKDFEKKKANDILFTDRNVIFINNVWKICDDTQCVCVCLCDVNFFFCFVCYALWFAYRKRNNRNEAKVNFITLRYYLHKTVAVILRLFVFCFLFLCVFVFG